jgi:uncharacterized membrane protein YphA (DoxX/SURF4 family)
MMAQTPSPPDLSTPTSTEYGYPEQAAAYDSGGEQPMEPMSAAAQTDWGRARCLLFRIAFVYFVVYALPFPFGYLPWTDAVASAYEKIWQTTVPWVAQHILRVGYEISLAPTGSGDTTYNWVQTFCFLALALVAGLIWSGLRRKRLRYDGLYHWLRLYVRLYLGATMISYGAAKVIQSQFPAPNLTRMLQTYGDSSPMGLLWTFMGASHGYNLFTGAAEMIGGVLLIIPPLATLGALITIAAMGNVFILNMTYDVPVKLYSFNLILMAIFIALPDTRRLTNVLVFNRRAEPAPVRPFFKRRIFNRSLLWLQLLLLIIFAGGSLYQSWQGTKFWDTISVDPAIHGIWSVDDFTLDGQLRPPSMSDPTRWQRVVVEYSNRLSVQFMDAPQQRYSLVLDPDARTMLLTNREDPNWKASFNYETPKPGFMIFKGQLEGHEFEARMHRKDPSSFRLTNRGFHWVNEYPFNR